VRIAASLAGPSRYRDDVRERLACAPRESTLFDLHARVREIESAFSAMADRHRRGEAPRSFAVERA
jgi:hypothetical protein